MSTVEQLRNFERNACFWPETRPATLTGADLIKLRNLCSKAADEIEAAKELDTKNQELRSLVVDLYAAYYALGGTEFKDRRNTL